VIEQRAVAVRGVAQPAEVIRQHPRVQAVDLRGLLLLLFVALVMRAGVMGIAKSQLGIGAPAHFMAHLEGDDARHVGLPRQHHEIGHQLEVVGEDFRDAGGASDGHLLFALSLRQLNAPLDIADRLQILVDLVAIRSTDLDAQLLDLSADRVEDATVFLSEGRTHFRIGARVAEETLEDRAWAVLHRKRRVLVAP